MAVSFMTWNVREGLAQPEQMPGVVDVITKARKDVVILPDAYSVKNPLHGSQAATLTEAKERLEEAGYRYMIETEYDDGWWHDRNIMMLGRVPLLATNVIRLGARNALEAKVFDRATQRLIDIIALHLSDVSPAERLSQTKHLLSEIDHSQPYVLAGDWNEMHHSGLIPALLGSSAVDSLLGLLPSERCRSLARRTHGMAPALPYSYLRKMAGVIQPIITGLLPALRVYHCYRYS